LPPRSAWFHSCSNAASNARRFGMPVRLSRVDSSRSEALISASSRDSPISLLRMSVIRCMALILARSTVALTGLVR